jgi:cation:H+ antiporter
MIVQILLVVIGLVLLTWSADQLVLGSSRLGRQLRVSPVVIGVVVIGLGTSAPEFLVSGLAAARGDIGLAVGNIVGSNILNLSLLLGVAAFIAPVPVAASTIRREVPLAVAAVSVFGLFALSGLDVRGALVLAAACAAALWLLVRWARHGEPERRETTGSSTESRRWVEPVRALLGLAGVLAGAQMLVAGASTVAAALGVTQAVIGFTLVAIGTSLPELVTTVQAQRRGESDLVVGNLFGSNLFNSLAGGAVIGFADPVGPARGTTALVVAMMTGALIAGALLIRGRRLTRLHGMLLGGLYLAVIPLLLSA